MKRDCSEQDAALASCFRMLFIFRVGREGERRGEKNRSERETLIGCLSYAPQLGTEPKTQAQALTKN